MDIRSYQAKAHAAANNSFQVPSRSDVIGRSNNVTASMPANLMNPHTGSTSYTNANPMPGYRPPLSGSQTAPAMPPTMGPSSGHLAYNKDVPNSPIMHGSVQKSYHVTDVQRNAFQHNAMGHYVYDYRSNDPRLSMHQPHMQTQPYGAPRMPPTSMYHQQRNMPGHTMTSGYGNMMPNGMDHRGVLAYNGDQKSSAAPVDNSALSTNDEASEPESSKNDKEVANRGYSVPQPGNVPTPPPNVNGGSYQNENMQQPFTQPPTSQEAHASTPAQQQPAQNSDPFAPSNRIMLPPPIPDKSYSKQPNDMFYSNNNAPRNPSPLVTNGARPGFQQSPPRSFGAIHRNIPPNKHSDFHYRMPNPANVAYNSGLAPTPVVSGQQMSGGQTIYRKPMGPPPSPNQHYSVRQNVPPHMGYNYTQPQMMQGTKGGATTVAQGAAGGAPGMLGVSAGSTTVPTNAAAAAAATASSNTSSASSPSPTLNQLLTNTHPSQYPPPSVPPNNTAPSTTPVNHQTPSSGAPPTPDKRQAVSLGQPAADLQSTNPQQQQAAISSPVPHNSSMLPNGASNNLPPDYNSPQSVKLENDHHIQINEHLHNTEMSNCMPSPSPSANSMSSLQEDESNSNTLPRAQMSPQVNTAPPPQMMGGIFHHQPSHPQASAGGGSNVVSTGPQTHMQHLQGSLQPPQQSSLLPPQQQPMQPPNSMSANPSAAAVAAHPTNNSITNNSNKDDDRLDHFLYSPQFGNEPGRKEFSDRLIKILEANSLMQTKIPCVAKHPVDLFRLYKLVREKGGFTKVCHEKLWKEIANTMELNNSPMASYNMRKHYSKFLLPFECQYDLNGADPKTLIEECDAFTRKRPPRPKQTGVGGTTGKKGTKLQQAGQANVANALVPSVESNGHTVNVCDPFSDEFLSVQRPPAPSMGHVPPPQPPMHAGFYQKQPFRPPYDPTVVAFSKPWPEAPNESPLSSNYRASMPPPPPPPNAHAPSAAAAAAAVAQYGSPHSSSAASSFHPSQTSPRMVIPQNNAPPDAVNRMPPYPPQVSPLEMPNVHMAAPRSRSQFGQPEIQPSFPYNTPMGAQKTAEKSLSPVQKQNKLNQQQGNWTEDMPAPKCEPNSEISNGQQLQEMGSDPLAIGIVSSVVGKEQQDVLSLRSKSAMTAASIRREINEHREFPPNSVEAQDVVLEPNMRVPAIYIGKGDVKKIMMCLKSGLLAETTWALETLTVVLFDDVTMHHISIDTLPGIIDILLQHLKLHLRKLYLHRTSTNATTTQHLVTPVKSLSSTDKETVQDSVPETEAPKKSPSPSHKNGFVTPNKSPNEEPAVKINESASHIVTRTDETPVKDGFRKRKFQATDCEKSSEEMKDSVKRECTTDGLNSCSPKRLVLSHEVKTEEELDNKEDSLSPLRRLKAMSQTQEDRDASSYNCLHSEVLSALQRQRIKSHPKTYLATSNLSSACDDYSKETLEDESYEVLGSTENLLQSLDEDLQDSAQRALCITNIFRSFSCLPINEDRLAKHSALLKICGDLLSFAHKHPVKFSHCKEHRKESSKVLSQVNPSSRLDDWEFLYLNGIRENCIVMLSNIAAKINLDDFDEQCVFGLMDSLIHWLICCSSYSVDPVPGAIHSTITMQRLALETLCKMCLANNNTDYLLATPPSKRICKLVAVLCDMVADGSQPAIRELALVLLTYISKPDVGVTYLSTIEHCVSKILNYLEDSIALILQSDLYSKKSSRNSSSTNSTTSLTSTSTAADVANLFMARCCSNLILRIAQASPKCVYPHRKQILLLTSSEVFATSDTGDVSAILSDVLFELNS